MRPLAALISFAWILVSPTAGYAGFVTWRTEDGGNGHVYGLVMPDTPAAGYSWTQARDAASAMNYRGSAGHLVTVGSAGENEFLRRQYASYLFDNNPIQTGRRYAWIGLFAPTPFSDFQWVTGEPVGYLNWAEYEPNFYGQPFWQYTHYWTRDFGGGPTWTWNNDRDEGYLRDSNTFGYIVEFDGPFAPSSPTPVPAGGLVLAAGAVGLVLAQRSRGGRS